jgi:hypothetical protein
LKTAVPQNEETEDCAEFTGSLWNDDRCDLEKFCIVRSLQCPAPASDVWSLSAALAAPISLHMEEIYPHLCSSFSLSMVPEIFMVSLGLFYIYQSAYVLCCWPVLYFLSAPGSP